MKYSDSSIVSMADRRCVLCKEEIPEKTKPEHVLLNSLGGRMTVRDVICPECNHKMGIGADEDLAKTTEFLRNICHLKAGDGDSAPEIRNFKTDGQRFDLAAGMKPRLRAEKPLTLSFSDEGFQVVIEAYSEVEADRLLTGAATSIAKRIGKYPPGAIDALKKEMLKDKRSSFRPAPAINYTLQFGSGRSQQSMAKSCLVLWARECGNAEVNLPQYEEIRHFIQSSDEPKGHRHMMAMDTRMLPTLPERFGTNPNVIWVGSNENGMVFGYFRLYGVIGWRFLLRNSGAPSGKKVCLISNPFDNKEWGLFKDGECPIGIDWVWETWDVERPDFNLVEAGLRPMLKYAHEASTDDWLRDLIFAGFQKSGCGEGEKITKDHIEILAEYISLAITAYITQKEISYSSDD